MSQTEETIQLTFDQLTAEDTVSDEEYNQSVKGNLQIAEEEPRANKSNLIPFLNWEGFEEKLLYFPKKDQDDNLNAGRIVYKAYLKDIPDKNKNISHNTLEEFENDDKYNQYKGEKDYPKLRYYVYVIEITPNGNKQFIWDMAKTKYLNIFGEYLDKNVRVLKVKPAKDPKNPPIVKIPTQAELKAILPSK